MKTSFLTSMARTVASTLMPSRINVEKDSLAKAIAKKTGKDSITSKTVEKLKSISNYNRLPDTFLQGSVERCTHEIPVNALKKQLQEVSLAPARSKMNNHNVANKIRRIVNTVEQRVGFAEDIWTQSYWKNRDGGTENAKSQASNAVLRLGYQPEWKDYRLALQVTHLAQDTELSTHTIDRMRAAFHGLYRIPQQDDANKTSLTFKDFPNPSNLVDFIDLSVAAEDLRDAYKQVTSFQDEGVRVKVERALTDLGLILQSTLDALLSRHDELVDKPGDSTRELNAIRKWLGAPEPSGDASVDAPSTDDDLDVLSVSDSEDSYITEISSDSDTDSIHSSSRPREYAPQAPAPELSTSFDQLMAQSHVSYAELTDLTKLFVQVSGIPDLHNDTRSPYEIHEFLAQRARQTPRTIPSLREEMQHIQLRLSGINSGQVRGVLQNQHFMFNDMIDRAEKLWKQVASERNPQGEPSPYHALACQWLGMPESAEPATQNDAVLESDPAIAARTVDASPEKPNALAMFAKAMGVTRRPDENIVEYEARSADAVSAVAEAFLNNIGFKLPASDDRKEHVLTDFPDALDMQTFRSLREIISELGVMRSQMRHVESVDIKQRLIDRLGTLYAAIEDAEDFWTDRLLELERRARAGESVKEDVHIARKWLGAHDPVTVRDVAANSIIGGEVPTDVGMRKAGEITDAVDEVNGGRRRTSQASHLFDQAAAEQTKEKRQTSAKSAVSRGYALMTALR